MFDRPVVPVVLAGGRGSRLWPLSRKAWPKPFHKFEFLEGRTLLQEAVWRLVRIENIWGYSNFSGFPKTIVIGEKKHQPHISNNLWQSPLDKITVLLEPESKGTALAIACAVREVQEKVAENAIVIVLPSDHFIKDIPVLARALQKAVVASMEGGIITLGLTPKEVSSKFGYILSKKYSTDEHAERIEEFVEKPSRKEAANLISEGAYWNSGMFVFSADRFSELLKLHAVGTHAIARVAYKEKWPVFGGIALGQEAYQSYSTPLVGVSIDRALIEQTESGNVVPLPDCGWSDLGTWEEVAKVYRDHQIYPNENSLVGNILVDTCKNLHVQTFASDRLIYVQDVDDLIIVDTEDVLFIVRKGISMAEVHRKLKEHGQEWAK